MSNLNLSLDELVKFTGGKLLNQASPKNFTLFTTDSRKAAADCVFLCIPGEKVDGHEFIPQAVSAGAAAILGADKPKLEAAAKTSPKTAFIHVPDALLAFQSLARSYREKFHCPVVGLTGSSGKTTTKDLVASILEPVLPTPRSVITEGTLNNHWGVPMTAMRLREETKAAVFEMGMSDFGEIATLTAICEPTIGYITVIGAAHLEKMGSLDGVLKAKSELFNWMLDHGQRETRPNTIIVNAADARLEGILPTLRHRARDNTKIWVLGTNAEADFRIEWFELLDAEHGFGFEYEFHTPQGQVKGKLPLPGRHNLQNALAATAIALATGSVKLEDIAHGLAKPKVSGMRSEIFQVTDGPLKGLRVYNDSYNANPTSMAALFEAGRELKAHAPLGIKNLVAAVGDMLELGPTSDEIHTATARKAAEAKIDGLFAVGKSREAWRKGYTSANAAATHAEAFEQLVQALTGKCDSTLILVKGSRGAKMDELIKLIRR